MYIMWTVSSQNRIELSAATTLKGKEAQTPSNKAFESGKTNTTNIPMLDITCSAHTVGITTVSAPIGCREAFSISNWLFFSTIEIGTVRLFCTSVVRMRRLEAATSRTRRYVLVATNVLLDFSLHSHSYLNWDVDLCLEAVSAQPSHLNTLSGSKLFINTIN